MRRTRHGPSSDDASALSVAEGPRARIRSTARPIFWVYVFPLIMVVALGLAFRSEPVESMAVDIQEGPEAERSSNLWRPILGFA
ncbi:MAG: hypothetical protein R3B91_23355 [Planctomycetaceae bacterium]